MRSGTPLNFTKVSAAFEDVVHNLYRYLSSKSGDESLIPEITLSNTETWSPLRISFSAIDAVLLEKLETAGTQLREGMEPLNTDLHDGITNFLALVAHCAPYQISIDYSRQGGEISIPEPEHALKLIENIMARYNQIVDRHWGGVRFPDRQKFDHMRFMVNSLEFDKVDVTEEVIAQRTQKMIEAASKVPEDERMADKGRKNAHLDFMPSRPYFSVEQAWAYAVQARELRLEDKKLIINLDQLKNLIAEARGAPAPTLEFYRH